MFFQVKSQFFWFLNLGVYIRVDVRNLELEQSQLFIGNLYKMGNKIRDYVEVEIDYGQKRKEICRIFFKDGMGSIYFLIFLVNFICSLVNFSKFNF